MDKSLYRITRQLKWKQFFEGVPTFLCSHIDDTTRQEYSYTNARNDFQLLFKNTRNWFLHLAVMSKDQNVTHELFS